VAAQSVDGKLLRPLEHQRPQIDSAALNDNHGLLILRAWQRHHDLAAGWGL
jgi:hypothetical protein